MKEEFKNDDTFLARWLEDRLSPEEQDAFVNSQEYATYKKIKEQTEGLSTTSWRKDQSWEAISAAGNISSAEKPSKTKTLRPSWFKYAVAASILAVVGYFSLFNNDSLSTYQTTIAETKSVTLPDGSRVHLNADSKLVLDNKSFAKKRFLQLYGEAFFEVEKGSQFTVMTTNGEVRVLGTTFNIRSRKDNIEVKCFSGKVGVSFDKFKNEKILTAGDVIISRAKEISETSIDTEDLSGPIWRSGQSTFLNSEFSEVIDELERQYDIDIKAEASIKKVRSYNGGFPHDNLDEALTIITSAINHTYKIEGKTVTIYKKK